MSGTTLNVHSVSHPGAAWGENVFRHLRWRSGTGGKHIRDSYIRKNVLNTLNEWTHPGSGWEGADPTLSLPLNRDAEPGKIARSCEPRAPEGNLQVDQGGRPEFEPHPTGAEFAYITWLDSQTREWALGRRWWEPEEPRGDFSFCSGKQLWQRELLTWREGGHAQRFPPFSIFLCPDS